MLEKPRLKVFLTIFPIDDNTWGLRGSSEELWRIKLRGDSAVRSFCLLLPHLDGRSGIEEICAKVSAQGGDPEAALALLEQMEKSFLIEDAGKWLLPEEEEHFQDQISFFSRFTAEGGAKLQSLLRSRRIGLVGDGNLGRSLRRHLELSGFGEVVAAGAREDLWPAGENEIPNLFVVAQEAHDPVLLQAMDAFSRENGVPWMLVRALDAKEGWVGPLFIPGETASYLSLEARLRGHMPYFDESQAMDKYLRENGRAAAPGGCLQVCYDLLSAIAVTEVIKLVTGFSVPQLAGRFLVVNFLTWDTEVHHVLRVPRLERDARPRVFPWKEVPYGDAESRRA